MQLRDVPRLLALRSIHAAFITTIVASRWLRNIYQLITHALLRPEAQRLHSVPSHVGIVVGAADASDVDGVARVVHSCAKDGVTRITLCDPHGELVLAAAKLRASLSEVGLAAQVLMAGELPSPASAETKPGGAQDEQSARGGLCIRVISLKSGRDDLVCAAKQLCLQVANGRLSSDTINEKKVDAELHANAGFPEPVGSTACAIPLVSEEWVA
jgi:hypothetical protein